MIDQDQVLRMAREAVDRSERFQGTGSELTNIREALRLLIDWCESEPAFDGKQVPG